MSMADVAVMETVRLLDKVRVDGQKDRIEKVNTRSPQKLRTYLKPKPPKAQPVRTEPFSILDPGRKKLTTVESQRVLAVLDECIKKTEIVSLLPFAIQNAEKFSSLLGDELLATLQGHGTFQNNLKDACMKLKKQQRAKEEAAAEAARRKAEEDEEMSDEGSPRESLKSEIDPDEIDEVAEQLAKTIQFHENQVTFSCKNILRLVSLNPPLVSALRSEVNERDENATEMIVHLKDLRGFILGRLLTTPLEEKEKIDYLRQISAREKKNSTVIMKLSAELKADITEKDKEISKRNDEIRRLKGDRHQLEKLSEDHIRRTRLEAEKSQQADLKASEGKQTTLNEEVHKLRNKLTAMTAEHRESELNLRKVN